MLKATEEYTAGLERGFQAIKDRADQISGKSNALKIKLQAGGSTQAEIERKANAYETNAPSSMSGEERSARRILTGRPIDPTNADEVSEMAAVGPPTPEDIAWAQKKLPEILTYKSSYAQKLRTIIPELPR